MISKQTKKKLAEYIFHTCQSLQKVLLIIRHKIREILLKMFFNRIYNLHLII